MCWRTDPELLDVLSHTAGSHGTKAWEKARQPAVSWLRFLCPRTLMAASSVSQPQRKGNRRTGGTAGGPLWVDRPPKAPPPPIFLLFLSLWERLVLVGTKGRSGGNGRGSARAPGARRVPAWTWTPCGDRAPASSGSPRPRGLPHRWYSGPPTLVSNWEPPQGFRAAWTQESDEWAWLGPLHVGTSVLPTARGGQSVRPRHGSSFNPITTHCGDRGAEAQ